jgi:hypothetical protein
MVDLIIDSHFHVLRIEQLLPWMRVWSTKYGIDSDAILNQENIGQFLASEEGDYAVALAEPSKVLISVAGDTGKRIAK